MPSVLRPEGAASAALAFHHAESISSTNGNKADFFDSFPWKHQTSRNYSVPQSRLERQTATLKLETGSTKQSLRLSEG
jgi:hypothetical protein